MEQVWLDWKERVTRAAEKGIGKEETLARLKELAILRSGGGY